MGVCGGGGGGGGGKEVKGYLFCWNLAVRSLTRTVAFITPAVPGAGPVL